MDLSDFCSEFSRLEPWRCLPFYKDSVRQILPIAFPPLRFPVSNTTSSRGLLQEVCSTDGGLLHDCLYCKIKNMFN